MLVGRDVTEVAELCGAFLGEVVDRDWTVVVPGMDWTAAKTVAHVADCLLWYATDITAGPVELSTADVVVRPDSSPADLVRTVRAFASVLAAVVDAAPADELGWHPWGLADPAGFAGMGCDEMLVHTHDAARALGLELAPPPELTRKVLARMFPDAPTDRDPFRTLLWANGRIALDDLPKRTGWRWHCAPLGS
ncbi:maleylpyruvate isomerase N-terminal domain-containing protein [Saccharothrix sp. NRRL B-16314]|uniref:maleylpyruvate isomerase N-terminal domain-containing protein n=1 Tax=Saccharothrix sp. NRRL B-16314 TaxID=1463825 RepID=UPI000527C250|nr:maleylpyruvate isomerase N-terminal domain-containing protein [Saccharothrix sp. NRRL B-16314]